MQSSKQEHLGAARAHYAAMLATGDRALLPLFCEALFAAKCTYTALDPKGIKPPSAFQKPLAQALGTDCDGLRKLTNYHYAQLKFAQLTPKLDATGRDGWQRYINDRAIEAGISSHSTCV